MINFISLETSKKDRTILKSFFLVSQIIFLLVVFAFVPSEAQNSSKTRKIVVNYDKEKGAHSKVFKECVGAGRANEGLRADWQQQLRMVQKEIGFR
jgi:xylan 1,4-beta-xylosidase